MFTPTGQGLKEASEPWHSCMYINNHLARSLRFYLGTAQHHTVYEAERVGLIMGLHLLNGLSHQLTQPTVRWSSEH